jgi:hypothetical protein
MNFKDVPEENKYYLLELSNKDSFKVNGIEKNKIMGSPTQFIQLKSGNIVNKSFIVAIKLFKVDTKYVQYQLTDGGWERGLQPGVDPSDMEKLLQTDLQKRLEGEKS